MGVIDFSASKVWLKALGDSQLYFGGYAVPSTRNWLTQVGKLITRQVGDRPGVVAQGFGRQGDTTTACLARGDIMLAGVTAQIAFLQSAVNDPVNSISSATTTLNLTAQIMALKHGAAGIGAGLGGGVSVAGQAVLPAQTQPGRRFVVLADTSSTGGTTPTLAGDTARIGGTVSADVNGNTITVWEATNPQPGESGWRRVATAATTPSKVKRFVVTGVPYRNFTAAASATGDTPSTAYAANAAARSAQQAAVTAQNQPVGGVPSVVYADVYSFQRSRIVAGTDPNFSGDTSAVATTAYDQTRSYHYTQDNQHLSEFGHWVYALGVYNAIPAAWLTEIQTALGG